jgi:predicted DCC family thiol-disulfide oxidoreductase YuxK
MPSHPSLPIDGPPQPLLLFDGVCNLCNASVQWVIKHDPKGVFRFASLQSDMGENMLRRFGLPIGELDTVVLVDDGKAYTRSDVPLRIFKKLGGWWAALAVFSVVPKSIRDAVYDWVARNRYRWFGKKDECWLPTPELRARFLG